MNKLTTVDETMNIFDDNNCEDREESLCIVEAIRNADYIGMLYNDKYFKVNEYSRGFKDRGYELAIDVGLCVCYFVNFKDGIDSYTMNKFESELTRFERGIIDALYPEN